MKRLQREKQEAKLCGNYELVYPVVTYKEEEAIKDRMAELREQQLQLMKSRTPIQYPRNSNYGEDSQDKARKSSAERIQENKRDLS